jgi:hypothetical protein
VVTMLAQQYDEAGRERQYKMGALLFAWPGGGESCVKSEQRLDILD